MTYVDCGNCLMGVLTLDEDLTHQHLQCLVCGQWWCAIDLGVAFGLHRISPEHAAEMAESLAAEQSMERQMAQAHLN